jgi:hypothetical protein
MTFPAINPLIETFLEPTRILLFGKVFPTLSYTPGPMRGVAVPGLGPGLAEFTPYAAPAPPDVADAQPPDLPMPPGRVEQALRQVGDAGVFARIYGFSFEGHYYKLPRPLLFLLAGPGDNAREPENPVAGGVQEFSTRFTGVEGKDWHFGDDIRVWAVDKHDIAVCLDLEVGPYDDVLLQSLTNREQGSFRGWRASRGTANFRGTIVGPHQER